MYVLDGVTDVARKCTHPSYRNQARVATVKDLRSWRNVGSHKGSLASVELSIVVRSPSLCLLLLSRALHTSKSGTWNSHISSILS